MGNHRYTANGGTYIHHELGSFGTQLPIGELTHTSNWGTFAHSYQLEKSHTSGTGEVSYTATNRGGTFIHNYQLGELKHTENYRTFIHSYQLGNLHTLGTREH